MIPAFFIAVMYISAAMAAKPIIIDPSFNATLLGLHCEYYEDTRKDLTIQDVISERISRGFKASKKDVMNFAYSDSAYWVRFSVKSLYPSPRTLKIELGHPLMDRIDFFSPGDGTGYDRTSTGLVKSVSSRYISHRHFIFNLPINPGETRTCFFRFESRSRLEIPLKLWSDEAFHASDHNDQYVMGLYLGILLFIFLFHLFLFISVREMTYLYYLLFIFSFGIFQLIQNGTMFEYFWPPFLEGYTNIIPLSIVLALVTFIQFAQSFLNMKIYGPRLNTGLTVIKWITAASLLSQFVMPYSWSIKLELVITAVSLLTVMTTAVMIALKKNRPARLFLISWVAFIFGALLYILKMLAMVPTNLVTTYAMQIGSVLQFMILSFAIGEKINLIKKQKAEAQQLALQNLELIDRQKDNFVKQLQETNRELSLSEERYRLLVEGSNDIIFSLDRKLNIITINKSVKDHFNLSPESLISKNILDQIYVDPKAGSLTRDFVKEKIDTFLATKESVTFRAQFKSHIKAEPKEMQVSLEFINIEGKNEIIGKASPVAEDELMKYFLYESQGYAIGNMLITTDDIAHRITRNLRKYLSQREVIEIRSALREIIINAIEHGNLEITFEEKTESLLNDDYFNLVSRRQQDGVRNARRVIIDYSIDARTLKYRISDEGIGFDYLKVIEKHAEVSEYLQHGRGILMARIAFDEVTYSEKGNEVVLIKHILNSPGTS